MLNDGPIKCRCGQEASLIVDTSNGPGCMCEIVCECGITSGKCWDVRIPWADLSNAWMVVQAVDDVDYIQITRDIARH